MKFMDKLFSNSSPSEAFIKTEKQSIQAKFDNAFLYLLAFARLLKETIFMIDSSAKVSNNPQLIKCTGTITRSIANLMMAIENFELKVPVYNTTDLSDLKSAFEERIEMFAITLSRIPLERQTDLMLMMQEMYQGNYKFIDDSLLDALIEHEDKDTVEGLGLIHEINPALSAEEKEYFAKRLSKWADYRSFINVK